MKSSIQKHSWDEEESNPHENPYKIVEEYIEYGCGFPVRLSNVPMCEDEGEWIPNIDYNKLDKLVLHEICKMPYRLTGNQIRFIRLYFEKTLEDFANILRVKHSSIIHWEKQKDNIAKITWGTELAIRLYVLYQIESGAKKFQQDYVTLMEQEIIENPSAEMKVDARLLLSD